MLVVITISLLALILTFLESKGLKGGMKMGFALVTLLGCIHYNYGNDYVAYHNLYVRITSTPFDGDAIINGEIFHDVGWVILNYAFKYLGGFFSMVAILNILQNVIIYKFISRTVEARWRVFAVFIYLFSTNFYLLNFSMMRQGLVVALFIFTWQFIKEKRWIISLIILLVATFIHLSAIVLLPFAFWGYLPKSKTKLISLLYVLIMFILALNASTVSVILDRVLTYDNFQVYANRYSDNNDVGKMGIGFIINMLPFIISMFVLSKPRMLADIDRRLILLYACSFLVLPFSSTISTVGRIGIYFSAIGIAALPKLYSNIKSYYLRFSVTTLFIIITLYDYYLFFSNEVYHQAYSEFHTIFEII